MSEKIETKFEGLKDYDEIESYYDYLEQAENFYRNILGDRVESQKYIVRANKEIERLHSIIKEVRELLNQDWYSVLRKGTITRVRQILEGDSNVS